MLRRHESAFTLVELLCVTAILLLLTALLLPAVDTARDRAVTASCQSQQRQLWIGFQAYCSDWNGAFACDDPWQSPGAKTAWYWHNRTAQNPWIDLSMNAITWLQPYVGRSAWIDPGMPEAAKKARPYGYAISSVFSRSYAGSSYPFGKTITSYQGYGPVSPAELPSPASTALMACKIAYSPQNLYNSPPTGGSKLALGAEAGLPWALHGPWWTPGIKTRSNVIRVDGSVRLYATREIVQCHSPAYDLVYGAPNWGSSLRHYLWSGWTDRLTSDQRIIGMLKE